MPVTRHATLLLPSPLGLLEYDVLEETAFLGPGKGGRLVARPMPFPEAIVLLSRTGSGFVVRAMPGEAAPEVNGEPATDAVLTDGDRIRLGEEVILFRAEGATAPTTPAAPPPSVVGAPRAPAVERPPRAPAPGGGMKTALTLLAACGLLLAAWRGMQYMQAIQDEDRSRLTLPEIPDIQGERRSASARNLAAVDTYAQQHAGKWSRIADKYRLWIDRHPGAPETEIAQARLRELVAAQAEDEHGKLAEVVDIHLGKHRFLDALSALRRFEERFGSTAIATELPALRRRVRDAAEARAQDLLTQAAARLESEPRKTIDLLLHHAAAFPPDIASRFTTLVERARRRLALAPRRGTPAPGDAPPDKPPREDDPEPGKRPMDPVPPPTDHPREADAQGRALWRDARAALLDGRYADAQGAYDVVLSRYAETPTVQEHRSAIESGREAARIGVAGPGGLLSVPFEMERGRLVVEYTFNDPESWEKDFTHEKPFASDRAVDVELKKGKVWMSGASGLIHNLVFTDEVRVEARVIADVAHDLGAIAMEEGDDYRAILFNINNTQFKLKKGAAAQTNPGHLLWYIGQGVWADADPDVHGFIKIAERANSKLEDGDEVRIEFERGRNNRAEGSFGAASDGVHLKGKVVGDNGSTMGSARVGLFVNTGRMRVQLIRISGKVDMAWFQQQIATIARGDPGPD